MENTQQTIDTLNDLVLINNDRIAGYEKAMAELKEKKWRPGRHGPGYFV